MIRGIWILVLLFVGSTLSIAQISNVEKIRITSTWGGLGIPQRSELVITCKPKRCFANGKKVEDHKVEALLQAVAAKEISRYNAANLGITQEWLDANAVEGINDYANGYISAAAPNQKELYLSTFRNLQLIESKLPIILHGGWTDDYPTFIAEIYETNGERTVVSSNAQPTFMLPWKIERKGKASETYNRDISRALVNLLPKKFANRDRLSGEGLRSVLARFVMRHIKSDWERIGAEYKAGDTMIILGEQYQIVSAVINSNHGLDFGDSWEANKNPGKNLHLILKKREFPRGFALNLKLPLVNGKVEHLAEFQANIHKYQELIFSIPWLREYIENGNKPVELRFTANRSFSEKAMKKFAEDMNKIGKGNLVSDVESQQENIALIGVGGGLEYYQSYWIVLPDRQVILWRYRDPNLLLWSERDFELKDCTDEISAGLKCVGALISPEGRVNHR